MADSRGYSLWRGSPQISRFPLFAGVTNLVIYPSNTQTDSTPAWLCAFRSRLDAARPLSNLTGQSSAPGPAYCTCECLNPGLVENGPDGATTELSGGEFFQDLAGVPWPSEHSILSAPQAWLTGQDQGKLWDLLRVALDDDRLVLVVVGRDEWVSPAAAEHAAARLKEFLASPERWPLFGHSPYAPRMLPRPTDWRRAAATNARTGGAAPRRGELVGPDDLGRGSPIEEGRWGFA